ncbi:NAD(P)H-dependent flavin oxidoreductase [Salisediminibacterium halotolerans]|uniref:Probable nitronate monooxygenase n=1 Tax=Salisediminibacterium halotolerans TaxID=517425 RepID=A0A1H9S142_9BACI|nr:nitronate monooxygenase [Salisediminibacterium haloalkalitolerans]SER78721.1 NAD(P)H-dependent flavin oxidoreductase YrpB, nitropropane dioxygenase family [Salisediminibacterium haloalkalitolerans]
MKMPELKIAHMKPKWPIIQGGMGVGISLSNLASAVSNAGGIGIISGTGLPVDELRSHIRKAREKTQGAGYIGVNCLYAMSDFAVTMKAALEEKVDFIISGAGISRDMYNWGKAYDTPVISIVSSAKLAKMSEKLGAAAVVVEGNEAGGHLGTEEPLFDLLPEIAEAVDIPVIAAGGITSGTDVKRALDCGASGVQMGTRFAASSECDASQSFKEKIIQAKETVLMDSVVGLKGRAIANNFTESIKGDAKLPINKCVSCLKKCSHQYCIYQALLSSMNGDTDNGLVFSGAGVERVNTIKSVQEIFLDLQNEIAYS